MTYEDLGVLKESAIEALARGFHDRYRGSLLGTEGETAAARLTWDQLPEDLKESNRESARAIPARLAAMGLRLRPATGVSATTAELPAELVEQASIAEHERWVESTQQRGYVFGPKRDEHADPPTHPDLIPWDKLDEPAREKDRARIREIPDIATDAGLEIVPSETGSDHGGPS